MAEIKKTSYEAIINALSREMAKTPADESQERIAARLDHIRLQFRSDHDTFSLILAGIADYDPPDGAPQKSAAVKKALDDSIRQRTIQCQQTELNTEPTGLEGIDRLRAVIAGTRNKDKSFGTVFTRNHLWGISYDPREYVVLCGFDKTGENFRTSDDRSVTVAGSSTTHIEKAKWRELWPDIPYQKGNYLIRSGQFYAFFGPEFADDRAEKCARTRLESDSPRTDGQAAEREDMTSSGHADESEGGGGEPIVDINALATSDARRELEAFLDDLPPPTEEETREAVALLDRAASELKLMTADELRRAEAAIDEMLAEVDDAHQQDLGDRLDTIIELLDDLGLPYVTKFNQETDRLEVRVLVDPNDSDYQEFLERLADSQE